MKALIAVGALLIAASAAGAEFERLYDYYFPAHTEYLQSEYRKMFDSTLFGPPLSAEYRPRSRKLYYAFRGDAKAFHAFLHDSDRDAAGEFSESWYFESLLLLLKLGDDRFAELLAHEDAKTREMVGASVDSHIDWTKHHFPKTRSLYAYRYVRPPKHDPILQN
jgi:hypothetical protein